MRDRAASRNRRSSITLIWRCRTPTARAFELERETSPKGGSWAKKSACAAVAAAAVNNHSCKPTDGLRRVTEGEPPGCYVFHERCRTRRYACVLAWSPEVPSCARCVLTQCVLCACVHRVQWQRRSTSSVNRHAAGRAAVLQLPGQQLVCVGQHLPLRYKVRSPAL